MVTFLILSLVGWFNEINFCFFFIFQKTVFKLFVPKESSVDTFRCCLRRRKLLLKVNGSPISKKELHEFGSTGNLVLREICSFWQPLDD